MSYLWGVHMAFRDITKYTKAEVAAFQRRLMLAIYYEFCHKAREQAPYEAGWETINKIGALNL